MTGVRMTSEQIARCKRLRATGFSYTAIGTIMKVDRNTVARHEKAGWPARLHFTKPIPYDFRLYCEEESIYHLGRRYSTSQGQVYEWLRQIGINRKSLRGRNSTVRPVPEDFRREGRNMSRTEAKDRWKAALTTITRWRKECGFPTPRSSLLERRAAAKVRIGWVERYVSEHGARA